MSATDTASLITGGITDYGATALVILGAVITLMVGYIAFKFGVRKIKGALR